MNEAVTRNALENLADMCMSASGDMHTAHLNYKGAEFDALHKDVLKTYYEQFADDYDSLAEFAGCYESIAKNPNGAAERCEWQSFEGSCDRNRAVELCDEVINAMLQAMVQVYNSLNKIDTCPMAVGISNWLQGRIEYWMKEARYFNARRK